MFDERFGCRDYLLAVKPFFRFVIGFVPILNRIDRVVLQIRKFGYVLAAITKNSCERAYVVRLWITQPFAVIQAFNAFSIDCWA